MGRDTQQVSGLTYGWLDLTCLLQALPPKPDAWLVKAELLIMAGSAATGCSSACQLMEAAHNKAAHNQALLAL